MQPSALSAQAPDAPASTPVSPVHVQTPASAEPKLLPDSTHVVIKKRFPVIYSHAAEEKKLHGTVVVSVLFNEAGAEESAEVVSGNPVLADCVTESMRKLEIQPYIRGENQ